MTPLMERMVAVIDGEVTACETCHTASGSGFDATYNAANGCPACSELLVRALLEVAGPEITEAIRQRDDRYFNDENFNFPDWRSLRDALLGEAP